jgi:hypothetical protein
MPLNTPQESILRGQANQGSIAISTAPAVPRTQASLAERSARHAKPLEPSYLERPIPARSGIGLDTR